MARKKKITTPKKGKPSKARKSKKKGANSKVNRYIAIRSATSKYCRENYGKSCPEKEMNRIYWELKARYGEVPISSVLDEMDVILGNKDRDALPDDLILFSWFHIEYLLFRADGLFFRADDIVLDLSNMGMGLFEGKYGEMPLIYRDEIYPTLRGRTYEAEANGWSASPLPTFNYNAKASNIKKRKFVWGIEQTYLDQKDLDTYVWQDNGQRSTITPQAIPQKGVAADAVRLAELQKDINAQREDALNRVERMLDMGVITKAEFKKYYDDIMQKYAKGGVV